MTTITYTIDVPQEEIEQLQTLLQQRNIPFDPRDQVTAFNDAFRADTTAYGHEASDIIESINTYLANASIEHRVRSDHHDWSIPNCSSSSSSPSTTSTGPTAESTTPGGTAAMPSGSESPNRPSGSSPTNPEQLHLLKPTRHNPRSPSGVQPQT